MPKRKHHERKVCAGFLLASLLSCAPPAQAPLRSEPSPPQPTATLAALHSPTAVGTSKPGRPARHVVLVSIDGLGARLLSERDTLGLKIPVLRRMFEQGASGSSLTPVYPSLTYPNHVTMMTGTEPREHGIANNFTFDPLDKNKDGWHWYAQDVQGTTLWDAARSANKTVGSVYFPVTVGAKINWNVPQFWRAETTEDDKLLRALTTPEVAQDLDAARLPFPGEHTGDTVRANVALQILDKHHPDLMLVYFEDFDTQAHKHGPRSKEALAALENIDTQLGRIETSARDSGLDTTIVIVSDHGFREANTSVRLGVALKEAGLVRYDAKKDEVQSWDATLWRGNGMCAVVLREPQNSEMQTKTRALFERLAASPKNGIGKIRSAAELQALGAFPSAFMALEAAPGFMFNKGFEGPMVRPSKERGAHGYAPDHADMAAIFVMSGSGIRKTDLGAVQMVDVAPTVAKLLGLSLPQAKGRSLASD
jgi:predicted AlkP superfamily pyrophosphatase or phosphodiesterase